jgi:hypothetical protein
VLWHYVDQPRRVVVTEKDDADLTGIIVEFEDETLMLVRVYGV